jgi:hypothetical protein
LQSIKIKNDVATVEGFPYYLILKEGGFVKNYAIKSLDNKVFIFLKVE